MAQRSLEIDMCAGSQLRDTQGEMLNVEGADIGELESGRGRINDNHGKGFFNVLGKVTMAKKIFKAEDCEDERQTYYWEKVKSPYIYVKAKLFNDEDHPNAKAAAAILRNIHKTDSPLKIKASVEGGVISRGLKDPSLLARTKIHSVALTFVPANQATLVEPLNLDKSEANTEADMILIKSVMHLAKKNVPSFRHITRDAQAERVENNVNKLLAALGTEDAINLKKALIEDSLESKIADNVNRIHLLMKTALEKQQDDTATNFAYTFQKAINELRQGILMDNLPENKIEEYIAQIYEQLEKALSAGYGGAGMPTGLTGGGVLQSESQELGPKNLSFITCDGCGKEQVYGKHQVKCRDCGKAFSMAKLEKFFSLAKTTGGNWGSKKNTPEQQAKIDQFMQRKAAGQPTHDTRNEGTMGHLPPQTPGTFHGQGATTSGKIVNKRFSYEKKGTDERGFGQAAQQEKPPLVVGPRQEEVELH